MIGLLYHVHNFFTFISPKGVDKVMQMRYAVASKQNYTLFTFLYDHKHALRDFYVLQGVLCCFI